SRDGPQARPQARPHRPLEGRRPGAAAGAVRRRRAGPTASGPRRRTRTDHRPADLRVGNPKKSVAAAGWSADQKRQVIMTLAGDYPLRLVCRLLGVPRSSVYYQARPPIDEAALKTALLDLAAQWPTYGYRRLTAMMRRLGWEVNGKRVRRWMD